MIHLYFWTTDNGYKARQGIEEAGLDYEIHPISLPKREQLSDAYLKINPAHKIPALIDDEGPGGQKLTLIESGAILKYAAEKSGNGLYPDDPSTRVACDQWLFYGSASFTTLTQQMGMFYNRFPHDLPEAKDHYAGVYREMMGILNGRLGEAAYLAGDNYTIADISAYPDVHFYSGDAAPGFTKFTVPFDDYPNVKRWHDAIAQRPAVQKAWGPY